MSRYKTATKNLYEQALIQHSISGDINKIHILLTHSQCKINWQDKDGNTALMHAMLNNHYEVSQYLILEVKVDITIENEENLSPLDYAIYQANNHCDYRYIILLMSQSSINSPSKNDNTDNKINFINNIKTKLFSPSSYLNNFVKINSLDKNSSFVNKIKSRFNDLTYIDQEDTHLYNFSEKSKVNNFNSSKRKSK